MKTPAEWLNTAIVFAFDCMLDDQGKADAITKIQLDAWRQGMKDAAKITEGMGCQSIGQIPKAVKAILEAHDKGPQ